ncbi:hypothetical protein FRB99_005027 [Tulasnella sp. 403]|nr:hypothetical protein FRB99_005027 [Tulasnella sp. 403]
MYQNVPAELWLYIGSYLRELDRRTGEQIDPPITTSCSLLHLSNTCRHLRQMVLPVLFQQISLRGSYYSQASGIDLDQAPGITEPFLFNKIRLLLNLKELGYLDHVQDMDLEGSLVHKSLHDFFCPQLIPMGELNSVPALPLLLPLLRNIRRLHLRFILCKDDTLKPISLLENLKELKFISCRIPDEVSWRIPPMVQSLSLQGCGGKQSGMFHWVKRLQPPLALTSLVIDHIVPELVEHEPLAANLRSLDFGGIVEETALVEKLMGFLANCHSLQVLRIRGVVHGISHLQATMRSLQAVLCDIRNVRAFVCQQPGVETAELRYHPVGAINIYMPPRLTLDLVGETSTTLRKLVIPGVCPITLESVMKVPQVFPNLRHLEFLVDRVTKIQDVLPPLQKLGKLQTLRLRGGLNGPQAGDDTRRHQYLVDVFSKVKRAPPSSSYQLQPMNSRRHPSGDPKYAGGERDDDFGPSRFVFSPNKRRTAPANRPHQASSNDNSIDPDTSADPIDLFETIAGTKHNIASRNAKTYGGGRSLLSSSKDRTSKNSQLSSESESGSKELSSKLHTKRKTKKAPKTRPKDASRPARPASTSSGRSDHVVFDEITIEDSPPAKTGKKERTLAEFPLGSPSPEASPPPTPKKSIEDFPMGAPSPGQKENLSSPSRPSKHISSKPLKPTGLVPTDDGKIQSFPMSLEPLAASPPESRDPPAKPSHGVTPFPLSELEIPPSPPADREASTGSAYSAFRSKQDDPSSDDAVEVEALTRTRYVSPSSQSSKRRSGDECDSDLDDPKTKRRKINRHLDASIRSSSQRLENVTVGQDLPSQPCPFCGEPFPPKPSRKLRDLLETVLRRAKRTATPGNPTGNVPWQISINVCQLHRAETTVLPEGQRRGWPKKLDFSGIPRRMKSFRLSLQAILDGTVKGGRGSFWDAACEDVRKHGTAAANSAQGQLSTFELTLPGYYGEQGYLVISTALQNMFPPQAIDPSQTAPLQPADFLRRVLLPETAVLLIIEDHDVSREEARTIMFESRSYGSAMFPAKDEGDTTIDDLDIDTPPPITAKPASKDKGKAREADAAPVWLRDVKKGVVQPQHLKWVRGSDGEIAKAWIESFLPPKRKLATKRHL